MTGIKVERLVHLCLDEYGLEQKPEKDDNATIGRIVNRLPKLNVNITLQQLAAELTLPNAKSFNPAIFKKSMHSTKPEKGYGLWMQNDSWENQQLFPVDIDRCLSFADAMDRCKKYRIEPAFVYTSFSETNRDKFRFVFCLPEPVDNLQLQKLIVSSLIDFIFPEADKKCRNPSRFFYGGKEVIYENYSATVNIHEIINAVCHHLNDKDQRNANKQIVDYCRAVGLNTINNKPGIIKQTFCISDLEKASLNSQEYTKVQQNILIYYRICGVLVNFYTLDLAGVRSTSKSNKTGEAKYNIANDVVKREKLRHINKKDILDGCKLVKEFISGEYWAYHSELFGIATNLLSINGGLSLLKKGLNSRSEYSSEAGGYKQQAFLNYFINDISKRNYNPEYCKEFCPYEAECHHLSTIIDSVGCKRGEVKELLKPNYVTIEEAERLLFTAFNKSLESDKRVNVIKAETGIGKTEAYIKAGLSKCIIAAPTHKLKIELAIRFRENGVHVLVTPKLPELEEYQMRRLDNLYQMGAHEKAVQYLHNLANENEELIQYFEELEKAMKYNGIVITTHERAINNFQEYDGLIIFDEDPVESILKTDFTKLDDIRVFRKATVQVMGTNYSAELLREIDNLIECLEQIPDGSKVGRSWQHFDIADIKNKIVEQMIILKYELYKQELVYTGGTNVFGFLNCDFFIKDDNQFNYIKTRALLGRKILIMSATAPKFIYKKMFGDDLIFREIPRVKSKGRLVQYPRYSCSRFQFRINPEHLDKLQKFIGDDKVITYKNYQEKFDNCVATFGALRGLDWLKGENIKIVGTPHVNPILYFLYALALGINFNDEDVSMNYRNIEYEGFSFYFNTFIQNEGLKEIQLWKIGSEIEQAIGRSRIVREDCTVTLFSNYPIHGAEFREIKGELDQVLAEMEEEPEEQESNELLVV